MSNKAPVFCALLAISPHLPTESSKLGAEGRRERSAYFFGDRFQVQGEGWLQPVTPRVPLAVQRPKSSCARIVLHSWLDDP